MNDTMNARDVQLLPVAQLAFVGDSVYTTLIRAALSADAGRIGEMHDTAARLVSAAEQSAAADAILPQLNETEQAIFQRGRNSHPAHVPKSADMRAYRAATGLEAVFGYLYLCGKFDRIRQIYALIDAARNGNNNPI